MKSSTQNIIEGKWNEVKGEAQKKWGKLTNDDLDVISGNRTKLLGTLQKNYGWTQADAEKQVADFERDWESSSSKAA